MKTANAKSNGNALESRTRSFPQGTVKGFSNGRTRVQNSVPDKRPEGHFSLDETQINGMLLRQFAPAIVLGLGTTGSRIIQKLINRIRSELGHVPSTLDYLMIDGASREAGMDGAHHRVLDQGGCGTDPNRGREVFRQQWAGLLRALNTMILNLSSGESLLSVDHTVREAADFLIIAGSGGSSGGMLHECISLIHAAAELRRIENPRVHVVMLGADMPMRDAERDPLIEQKHIVVDTAACNLLKLLADSGSDSILEEMRPDGQSAFVKASDRVASITVVDQSNGSHELATTSDLIDMVAETALLTLLTEAGKFLVDRKRDHDEIGVTSL